MSVAYYVYDEDSHYTEYRSHMTNHLKLLEIRIQISMHLLHSR
jgi:hypothetical protein